MPIRPTKAHPVSSLQPQQLIVLTVPLCPCTCTCRYTSVFLAHLAKHSWQYSSQTVKVPESIAALKNAYSKFFDCRTRCERMHWLYCML